MNVIGILKTFKRVQSLIDKNKICISKKKKKVVLETIFLCTFKSDFRLKTPS